MLSKSMLRARLGLAVCGAALLAASCLSALPWRSQPAEVNLAFVVDHNLLYVPSVTIDNRAGRYFFSTAAPRTVIDPRFMSTHGSAAHVLRLNQRDSLRITAAVPLSLGTTGDAMIGADVWNGRVVTIDYHAGLLTYQKRGMFPELMTLYSFRAAPTVTVTVDGREINAIVDTASPDTLELPATRAGRRTARIAIAGSDFGNVDIGLSPWLTQPRVGNRLLAHFLMSIDYGRRVVGLWRDPRNR